MMSRSRRSPLNLIRSRFMSTRLRQRSIFRGLAASGWHTAGITMRLLVHSDLRPAGGIIGMGLEEMQWPRPVRPGDELHVETEILQVRPSASKPSQGLLKVRNTTFNQKGEAVLSQTVNSWCFDGRRRIDHYGRSAILLSPRSLICIEGSSRGIAAAFRGPSDCAILCPFST